MNKLRELLESQRGKVVDKWGSYISQYEKLFGELQEKMVRLLEIGVQNGGSLELWAKYFTAEKCEFIGVDIDERCGGLKFEDPRIKVIVCDAKNLINGDGRGMAGVFDIIIDDGSHTSWDIIATFGNLWSTLAEGGHYIIEDLHCAYWGGMYADCSISSMEFLKGLVDCVNNEHRVDGLIGKYEIESIEFRNSLCIIKKAIGVGARLGERLVRGEERVI